VVSDRVDDVPDDPLHRHRLIDTLAAFANYAGGWAEGIESLEQALAHSTKLVADFPQVPDYHSNVSRCYSGLGEFYMLSRDWDKAAEYFRLQLDLTTKLVGQYPSVTNYRAGLANALINSGEASLYRGEPEEARKIFGEALGHGHDLLKAYPDSAYYAQAPVIIHYLLDCTFDALGESGKAAEERRAGDQLLEESGQRLQKTRGPS